MVWPPPMLLPLPREPAQQAVKVIAQPKMGATSVSGFQEEHYKNTLALGVSFSVWRLTMVDLHMLGVFYSTWRRTMVDSGVCDAGAPDRWQIAASPGAIARVEQCLASSRVLRHHSLDHECFVRLTGVGPC